MCLAPVTMGCCQSGGNLPPPEYNVEVGKGGSTIMYGQHAQPPPEVPESKDEVDVGKGGSMILFTNRITTGDALDWEPGEPIRRPEHSQSDDRIEHTTATALADKTDSASFSIRYGFCSEQGHSAAATKQKPNQDSLVVVPRLGDQDTVSLFAVFDGHGPFGEHAAHFCRCKLAKAIQEHHAFTTHPDAALASSFEFVHKELVSHHTKRAGLDATVSGTTAVAVVVTGDVLHIANCGDSRGIMVVDDPASPGSVVGKPVTRDHKPDRQDERTRVQVYPDAKVYKEDQLRSNGDPNKWYICRTNDKRRIVYGVMFTRSIGDADATAKLGIIAKPEMSLVKLKPAYRSLVLATDGVWDVLSNQEVADIVHEHSSCQQASAAIVHTAVERWNANALAGRRDDITAVVVSFDFSTAAETVLRGDGAGGDERKMTVAEDDDSPASASPNPLSGDPSGADGNNDEVDAADVGVAVDANDGVAVDADGVAVDANDGGADGGDGGADGGGDGGAGGGAGAAADASNEDGDGGGGGGDDDERTAATT